MKYIFLDIDGVLNHGFRFGAMDDKLLDNLNKLIEATDAQIILSSDWRYYDRYNKRHREVQSIEEIKAGFSIYPAFPTDRIIGATPSGGYWYYDEYVLSNPGRVREIETYLKDHPEIQDYLILEDFYEMPDHEHRTVLCDEYDPITDKFEGFCDTRLQEALSKFS